MVVLLLNFKALIQEKRTVERWLSELPISRTTATKECGLCLSRQVRSRGRCSCPLQSVRSRRHCYMSLVFRSVWFSNPSYYLLKITYIVCSSFTCLKSFQRTENLYICRRPVKQHKRQANNSISQLTIHSTSSKYISRFINQLIKNKLFRRHYIAWVVDSVVK
jgi:hypothetical protein